MSKTQIILDNTNPEAFALSSIDYTNYYPGDSRMFVNGFEKLAVNYASLDGDGFSLIDETMVFAQSGDYVGNLTKTVTNSNGEFSTPPTLTITFSRPIDLKEGLQLWFSPVDVCVRANVVYEFEDGTQITTSDPGSTSPVILTDETAMEEYQYGLLKKIYFTPLEMYTKPTEYTVAPVANSFLRIVGFHYGYSVDLGENCAIGPITVYHELALTSDDAPVGSIDLTIYKDPYTVPQEGQTMTIISEQSGPYAHTFQGKYTIDTIEQTSENTIHITGYDDISRLESTTWDDAAGAAPSYITAYTGVPITYQSVNDPTYHYNYIGYMEEDKTTCRQWLAMYCTCQLCGFTTFNSSEGIYQVRWDDTDGFAYHIGADKILGEAKYTKRERYAGVVVEMDDDGETIHGQVSSGYPLSLCSKGWYKNQSNVFLRLNSHSASLSDRNAAATRVAGWMNKYLNGAEVECTIIYKNAYPGMWVTVETPHNGTITGVVRSIELSLNSTDTAKIVVREAVQNG